MYSWLQFFYILFMNLLLEKFQKKSKNVELQLMIVTRNIISRNAFRENKLNVVEVYYISYHIRLLSTDGVYGSD